MWICPEQLLQKKKNEVTIVIDDNDDGIVAAIQKLQKELEDRQLEAQRKKRQEKLDKLAKVTDELARRNISAGVRQHLKRRRTEPVDARFFDSFLLAAKWSLFFCLYFIFMPVLANQIKRISCDEKKDKIEKVFELGLAEQYRKQKQNK